MNRWVLFGTLAVVILVIVMAYAGLRGANMPSENSTFPIFGSFNVEGIIVFVFIGVAIIVGLVLLFGKKSKKT